MPGWFPCGSDSWPLVAEALQSRGEPWPYELMLDDLAWWDDLERVTKGRKKRPGRTRLRARWGMPPDRLVREALRDEAWGDRQKQGVYQPRTNRVPTAYQPRTSAPTENADNEPETYQSRTKPVPTAYQERPHARSSTLTPHPAPSPENKQTAAFGRLAVEWAKVRKRQGKRYITPVITGSAGSEGGSLLRMLKAHGEAKVSAVLSYLATADDGRANFYEREKLNLSNLRPNFDSVATCAEMFEPARSRGAYGDDDERPSEAEIEAALATFTNTDGSNHAH